MDERLSKTLKLIDGQDLGTGAKERCEVRETERSDVDFLDAYSRAVINVAEAVGPAVVSISIGRERAGEAQAEATAG